MCFFEPQQAGLQGRLFFLSVSYCFVYLISAMVARCIIYILFVLTAVRANLLTAPTQLVRVFGFITTDAVVFAIVPRRCASKFAAHCFFLFKCWVYNLAAIALRCGLYGNLLRRMAIAILINCFIIVSPLVCTYPSLSWR